MENKLELIEPWKANEYSIVKNDEGIVYVGKNKELASLIAAAPELLEGLQCFCDEYEKDQLKPAHIYDLFQTLIKKATE